MCGEEGHWEEDCLQADVDMPQAKRHVTFARPLVGLGVSREVAAARTAEAITASGETRRLAVLDKIQRFKFGGDGDPVALRVQIGDATLSASMCGEF